MVSSDCEAIMRNLDEQVAVIRHLKGGKTLSGQISVS